MEFVIRHNSILPSNKSALPNLPLTHCGLVEPVVESVPLFPCPEKSCAIVDVPFVEVPVADKAEVVGGLADDRLA